MIDQIAKRQEEVANLCRRYGVRRLEVFGSAVTGGYGPDSDLDFLVEFEPQAAGSYADRYFGFMEALQQLFGRPVDLVVATAIKNPYFRKAVEDTKEPLYAV